MGWGRSCDLFYPRPCVVINVWRAIVRVPRPCQLLPDLKKITRQKLQRNVDLLVIMVVRSGIYGEEKSTSLNGSLNLIFTVVFCR